MLGGRMAEDDAACCKARAVPVPPTEYVLHVALDATPAEAPAQRLDATVDQGSEEVGRLAALRLPHAEGQEVAAAAERAKIGALFDDEGRLSGGVDGEAREEAQRGAIVHLEGLDLDAAHRHNDVGVRAVLAYLLHLNEHDNTSWTLAVLSAACASEKVARQRRRLGFRPVLPDQWATSVWYVVPSRLHLRSKDESFI